MLRSRDTAPSSPTQLPSGAIRSQRTELIRSHSFRSQHDVVITVPKLFLGGLTLLLRFLIMNGTDLLEFDLTLACKGCMSIEASKPASSESIMSWTAHLARQRPAMTVVLIAFLAFASAVGYVAVGPAAAVLVTIALVAFLSDFLFPVQYVITGDRAACRMLLNRTEIKWTDVKRCYLDDYGVKLSPLDRVSRLEAFRGVYLRFNGNESQVIETVKLMRAGNV